MQKNCAEEEIKCTFSSIDDNDTFYDSKEIFLNNFLGKKEFSDSGVFPDLKNSMVREKNDIPTFYDAFLELFNGKEVNFVILPLMLIASYLVMRYCFKKVRGIEPDLYKNLPIKYGDTGLYFV